MYLRKASPTIVRIADKYIPEPNSGCWLWIGAILPNGYGTIQHEKRTQYAHRVSYMLFKGEIPAGHDLDHLCRNRCCINPDHLEPVTRSVNLRRGIGPKMLGDRNALKKHCPRGHAYEGGNLRIYNGKRQCRACVLIHKAAYRKRRAANGAAARGLRTA